MPQRLKQRVNDMPLPGKSIFPAMGDDAWDGCDDVEDSCCQADKDGLLAERHGEAHGGGGGSPEVVPFCGCGGVCGLVVGAVEHRDHGHHAWRSWGIRKEKLAAYSTGTQK
ncbi:hypothetical protein EDB19DRAFT_1824594 [Suillus lakei]|nr:hypothetical protein EDB19DRAFT_1824594 [Suillus lakei]